MSRVFSTPLIYVQLSDVQRNLEILISGTPSGIQRNKLCDANIHIMAALESIESAAGISQSLPSLNIVKFTEEINDGN